MSVSRLDPARSSVQLPEVSALDSLSERELIEMLTKLGGLTERARALLATANRPQPPPASAPSLVDDKTAAACIGVPPSWLGVEARRGTIRSYKRGHYRRFDPREVVEDFKRLTSGRTSGIQRV